MFFIMRLANWLEHPDDLMGSLWWSPPSPPLPPPTPGEGGEGGKERHASWRFPRTLVRGKRHNSSRFFHDAARNPAQPGRWGPNHPPGSPQESPMSPRRSGRSSFSSEKNPLFGPFFGFFSSPPRLARSACFGTRKLGIPLPPWPGLGAPPGPDGPGHRSYQDPGARPRADRRTTARWESKKVKL